MNTITKNKYFSFQRFMLLLKKEAQFNVKRDLLIVGAMFSLFTLVMTLVFEFDEGNYDSEMLENLHFIAFTVMLFVGGVFISSFSFMELRDKLKSHFYLLTPGSNFEKFLGNLLISLVAYILFMIVTYLTYSWIFNWIVFKLYGLQFSPLNLISEEFLIAINVFVLVHSISFLGSITFKKYPVIFTPIAGFILLTVVSLFNELMEKIVFAKMDLDKHLSNIDFEDFFGQYENLFKFILFYVIPIILWITTYLKLNEKEY